MHVRRLVRSRLLRTTVGLALVVGGVVATAPAAGARTLPPGVPTGGEVGVLATIESAEEFCGFLSDVYVHKPTWYTVRTVNCRSTDVFVKGRYANGSFGTCVLVPARHSRHLGGSLLRPMEASQIC